LSVEENFERIFEGGSIKRGFKYPQGCAEFPPKGSFYKGFPRRGITLFQTLECVEFRSSKWEETLTLLELPSEPHRETP